MKIYFANRQFLNISNFNREIRNNGKEYCSFGANNLQISFKSLKTFLSNNAHLDNLCIVDKNTVIYDLSDCKWQFDSMCYTLSEDAQEYVNVQLVERNKGEEV